MKNYYKKYIGKSIDNEEQKKLQLDILKYVADYCEKHNLRYFLADGTLIGAVRHHGYIPWDDDIDIRMPRPDYEKICKIFNEKDNEGTYHLINPTDENAQHYFVKIIDTRTIKIEPYLDYSKGMLGIDIDVFPIDGAPSDSDEYDKMQKDIRAYNKAYMLKKKRFVREMLTIGKDFVKKRFKAHFCPFLSSREVIKKVKNISMKYNFDKSEYVCNIGIGDRYRFPKSCYENYIMMPFEDSEFRVPVGYDEILTAHYGDYMKLPPTEKQVTHHVNNVFWKKIMR